MLRLYMLRLYDGANIAQDRFSRGNNPVIQICGNELVSKE